MSDDFVMRVRLQQVAAYRELCRSVRRSGRENVVFAVLMMFLAYLALQNQRNNDLLLILYGILIGGELLVGLFKWLVPSAEGILLDGLVLLVFAAYNFGLEFQWVQKGRQLNPVIVFLGVYMLFGSIGRFKTYRQLRRLFAERPSVEHLAWFDDLIYEIRHADPEADEQALDLPTSPHWKAKLLGSTAFFVARWGTTTWIAGPDEFEILREKIDRGTGRRKAFLRIHDRAYPEFEISDVAWANYLKWRASNPGAAAVAPIA